MNAPAGILSLSAGVNTGTLNLLNGDFTLTAGTLTRSAGAGAINFNKVGTQTVTNNTGAAMSGTINCTVSAATTLDFTDESFLAGTGKFTMNGILLLRSLNGTGALVTGTTLGNVRMSGARAYASGSRVIYRGAAAQVIGSGQPAAAGVTTEIDNTSGVFVRHRS